MALIGMCMYPHNPTQPWPSLVYMCMYPHNPTQPWPSLVCVCTHTTMALIGCVCTHAMSHTTMVLIGSVCTHTTMALIGMCMYSCNEPHNHGPHWYVYVPTQPWPSLVCVCTHTTMALIGSVCTHTTMALIGMCMYLCNEPHNHGPHWYVYVLMQ